MKKYYKKLSSVVQNRTNDLLEKITQPESSIQLSSSIQALSSFSSSITIISTSQNRTSYESRTQYEPDIRQNRYTDIRNYQFVSASRYEDRQLNSESSHENRSFNPESRFENRHDHEPNRLRNRQYKITEYADENLRSMNMIRRASQFDYQAFELYVSLSFSEINQSDERITYAKELSALNKLYKNEEKFEDTEDNFDFKLTIYLDKCKFADLSEHAYEKGVSLMLTNETLTYYYVNRNNFITFNDFCISMQLYFEDSQ